MIRTLRHLPVLTIFAGAMALASNASAGSLTWDLTGTSTASGSSYGNTQTYTIGGVTVTASAWGYTYGSGDSALEKAQLGKWSVGIGACDQAEGTGCGSPTHQVDNVGPDNFVLFVFSEPIDVTNITIDPYGVFDRDVTYWTGTVKAGLDLSGQTYSSLGSLGFASRTDDLSTPSEAARAVNISGGYVNAVLFGAMIGAPTGADQDYFKIRSIAGDRQPPPNNPVPEPGSLVLLGGTLLGAALVLRRRK